VTDNCQVYEFVKDYIMAVKAKRVAEDVYCQTILVGWNPPGSGWIRLNSCKERGIAVWRDFERK